MTSASVVSSTSGEKSVAYTINHVCIVQLSFNDRYFILHHQFHEVKILNERGMDIKSLMV